MLAKSMTLVEAVIWFCGLSVLIGIAAYASLPVPEVVRTLSH